MNELKPKQRQGNNKVGSRNVDKSWKESSTILAEVLHPCIPVIQKEQFWASAFIRTFL